MAGGQVDGSCGVAELNSALGEWPYHVVFTGTRYMARRNARNESLRSHVSDEMLSSSCQELRNISCTPTVG